MKFVIGDTCYIKGEIVKIEIDKNTILYTLEFSINSSNLKTQAIFPSDYVLNKGEI